MKDDELPAWWCEKEIQAGKARVIWVEATTRNMAGWAIPGGEITGDRQRAEQAAATMNDLLRMRYQ